MTRRPGGVPSPRERGLRRLAAGARDRREVDLRQALASRPTEIAGGKSADLDALVDNVAVSMPAGTSTDERVAAFLRLLSDEASHIELTDERMAVVAALHLDHANREPTIDARLAFARDRGDFGVKPSGRRHGYDALRTWWGNGVRLLSAAVDERIAHLRDHQEDWHTYFAPTFRRPPEGAQPFFMELFVTTVFMKGRSVARRVTERLVTAQEDEVRYYTARALPELDDASTSVPVRALWGCAAERLPSSPGLPILTRLWFPVPLRRGQRHYFASEAVGRRHPDRRAINVEVDYHGIASGTRLHGQIPVAGLTIRVSFDVDDLPEAVWWYADVTERARYSRPAPGSERLIPVSPQGFAEHTFSEPCQPLANYGLSFGWPDS